MDNAELYFLRSSEASIVKNLLVVAARLEEDRLENHPYLEQYYRNYGNYNGDIGVYAMVDNVVAGGAWVRKLANGFGHVDANTPELAFGVYEAYRNQGLGSRILTQLLQEVSRIYPQVSLSVREDNPVINLYKRCGFSKIEGSEKRNSFGSYSFVMLKVFDELLAKEQSSEQARLEAIIMQKSFEGKSV